jgi:energy-converting hydrogenase Eha subunit B
MRRLPVLLATGAVVCAMLTIVAAYTVPAYSVEESTDAGSSSGTATMVEVNGNGIVWFFAGLTLLALLCWLGLHRRCAVGSLAGTVVAWLSAVVATAAGMVSFDPFLLPIGVMMIVAVSTTPKGSRDRPTGQRA